VYTLYSDTITIIINTKEILSGVVVLNISGAKFLKMKSSQIKIQRSQAPHVVINPTFLLRIGGKAICGCLICLTP